MLGTIHRLLLTLLLILSGIDWLLNLFRPLLMAYNLMVPWVTEQFSIASDFQIVTTIMMGVLLFNSGITVSVIAVVRFIHVKFPFYHVRKRWIVLFMLFNMCYSFTVWMYNTLCFGHPSFLSLVQGVWGNITGFNFWFILTMMLPFYIMNIGAMVTSILTVYELHKMSEDAVIPLHRRSCNTILMMNCMNFAWFLLTLLNHIVFTVYPVTMDSLEFYERNYGWLYLQFIVSCFMPSVVSAVNPMILTFRSSKIKKMVKGWASSIKTESGL